MKKYAQLYKCAAPWFQQQTGMDKTYSLPVPQHAQSIYKSFPGDARSKAIDKDIKQVGTHLGNFIFGPGGVTDPNTWRSYPSAFKQSKYIRNGTNSLLNALYYGAPRVVQGAINTPFHLYNIGNYLVDPTGSTKTRISTPLQSRLAKQFIPGADPISSEAGASIGSYTAPLAINKLMKVIPHTRKPSAQVINKSAPMTSAQQQALLRQYELWEYNHYGAKSGSFKQWLQQRNKIFPRQSWYFKDLDNPAESYMSPGGGIHTNKNPVAAIVGHELGHMMENDVNPFLLRRSKYPQSLISWLFVTKTALRDQLRASARALRLMKNTGQFSSQQLADIGDQLRTALSSYKAWTPGNATLNVTQKFFNPKIAPVSIGYRPSRNQITQPVQSVK